MYHGVTVSKTSQSRQLKIAVCNLLVSNKFKEKCWYKEYENTFKNVSTIYNVQLNTYVPRPISQ